MTITATELKNNLGKYLEMVKTEDILITKNGKIIASLCDPILSKLSALESLTGALKTDEEIDLKDIKEERLRRQ